MNIVQFIEARIAEDEAVAREAIDPAWPGYDCKAAQSPAMPHIARHDPARVLRQCEALRDAVAAVQDLFEEGWSESDAADLTIKASSSMAAIWSDHPDYQQEWATP